MLPVHTGGGPAWCSRAQCVCTIKGGGGESESLFSNSSAMVQGVARPGSGCVCKRAHSCGHTGAQAHVAGECHVRMRSRMHHLAVQRGGGLFVFRQVPHSVPCVVCRCVCANRSFNEGLSVLFLQCPCGRKVSFPGAGGGGRDATRHNHPAPNCAPGADTPGPIPTETLKRSSWDLAHLLTPGQYPPRAWGRYPQRDDRTRYLQGTWELLAPITLYTLRICCACAA